MPGPSPSVSEEPGISPPGGPKDRLSKGDLLIFALFIGILLFIFRDFVFADRVFF